jgi:hypothetical protein
MTGLEPKCVILTRPWGRSRLPNALLFPSAFLSDLRGSVVNIF